MVNPVSPDTTAATFHSSKPPAKYPRRDFLRRIFWHPVAQNIGIWILALVPFILAELSSGQSSPGDLWQNFLSHFLPACIYFALPIYTHAFFILPNLYKGRYGFYITLFLINVLFWAVAGYNLPRAWVPIRAFNLVFQVVLVGGVTFFGAVIKIAWNAVLRQHRNRQAELKLLRDQLNPHFLFNTLNNLYGLAVQKSDSLPPLMLKLSDLLRYSLYETKERTVPLQNELAYIQNYISLESIRLADRADIDFRVEGLMEGCRIAPLLLIVFVENCFKHLGSAPGEKGFVEIYMQVENGRLDFIAKNSCWKRTQGSSVKKSRGIGLANVEKRLQLLYPDRYALNVGEQEEIFRVHLKLNFS